MVNPFTFSPVPEIHFGAGKIAVLQKRIKHQAENILIVTGQSSFIESHHGKNLLRELAEEDIRAEMIQVKGEPTVQFIDEVCSACRGHKIDTIVAIGGGSVMDAGKAISAMLLITGSVKDYLEGFPLAKSHPGTKVHFIAVPTTAGTGSEVTKNAVISELGENGFKRSLRHENFIPDVVIVDPELALNCPPNVTAASGLDALTQLLESYVSTQSSAITDALAFDGLTHIFNALPGVYYKGNDIILRSHMAYAALLSGITLANAGLGAVHGFASSIGGFFHVPHGVICGTLIGEVNRANIQKILIEKDNHKLIQKYANVGRLISGEVGKQEDFYALKLSDYIDSLVEKLRIPKLGTFGIDHSDITKIVFHTGIKNNPINLTQEELTSIVKNRI
jgi:alcohol dehydrogenase class IV